MDYNNWYSVAINTNKERSTKTALLARKAAFMDTHIEDVEYPTRKEIVILKNGQRKVKNKLLMPGYILVKVRPQMIEDEDGNQQKIFPPDTFDLIIGTPDIKYFANCERMKPIPFRQQEIKKIFDMCDDAHLEVKQNLLSDFQEGDQLDVVSGPFAGMKCEVVSVQGDKILGQLDMFGRSIPAEFTKEQVYKK